MTTPGRSLSERRPMPSTERLLAELVPPRHFAAASFDSYRPDPAHPSQTGALEVMVAVSGRIAAGRPVDGPRFGWRLPSRGDRARGAGAPPAIYLDGGFGVGKTHLLAALARAVGHRDAAYGTFVEYTNLVGVLGFGATRDALAAKRLVCIDEFELDDPGDTVLMSRLLRELADGGVALAATSNTLPESLGEGRFAAEDFMREIQALAERFEVVRIDGPDYRHREVRAEPPVFPDTALRERALQLGATVDDFGEMVAHLATIHSSRYGALLDGVGALALTGVGPLPDQSAALRLVVLVDRLYDSDVPVLLGGGGIGDLFSEEMLTGGYRKKYFRALSRLGALAIQGAELTS